MRLLHLSDLHLTKGFVSLDDAFLGVRSQLEEIGKLDFVVVSGDLSQAATEQEYEQLLKFAKSTLLPLVPNRDPARVVFVPGNHDVDWKAPIASEEAVGALVERLTSDEFGRLLKELERNPSGSNHRLSISRTGHLRVHAIDRKKYADRFANVRKFLRTFYGKSLCSPHRGFNLNSEGEDWSAHVFPQERVAFVGFNSCHENDRYWTGARIDPRAIAAAEKHLRTVADDCRPVAVWHHGIASEEQRPDYLTPSDLGRLFSAGFRLGLHGHTHRAEAENLSAMFGGRSFTVVATGSLGAGAEERPGAVGNQFSVVDLHGEQMRVRTFERGGKGLVYEVRRDDRLPQPEQPEPKSGGTRAREHLRLCRVDEQGIASIEVTLKDVHLDGYLVLALLTPPFCGVQPDGEAQTDRGPRPVNCEELPDGRQRCVLVEQTGEFKWIKWSYHVSSTLALDAGEFALLPTPAGWQPKVGDREQVRPHTVRFWCDVLQLELEYATPVLDGSPRALAERRTSDTSGGFKRWEPLASEVERCEIASDGVQKATLTVEAPRLNCRYGIVHRIRQGERTLSREALKWADRVLRRCRDGEVVGTPTDPFDEVFARAFAEGLRQVLAENDLSEIRWLGLLWNESRRLLSTAFQNFGRRGWAARFAVGSGVVGHAVRTRHVAAWNPRGDAVQTVIYEPRSALGSKHAWIVAVPLTLGEFGSPVGAVSLWATETHTRASRQLDNLAEECLTDRARALTLLTVVNQTFWDTSRELGLVSAAEWPDVAAGVEGWLLPRLDSTSK